MRIRGGITGDEKSPRKGGPSVGFNLLGHQRLTVEAFLARSARKGWTRGATAEQHCGVVGRSLEHALLLDYRDSELDVLRKHALSPFGIALKRCLVNLAVLVVDACRDIGGHCR